MTKLNGAQVSSIESLPQHIAVIMDGNGRWAKSKGLPRLEGHRRGEKSAKALIKAARKSGLKYLTLFAFSTENWQRPVTEVTALMKMFQRVLDSEINELIDNDIRLRIIGQRKSLDPSIQKLVESAEEKTKKCSGMTLSMALSYGGRSEIVDAAKALAKEVANGSLKPEEINESVFTSKLYAPDIPEPDLLIRTSGESRISNFLLWQCAYSEIVISPVFWPDFDEQEFQRCIDEYSKRSRRFGMTADQIQEQAQAV
ncbi:MAG: isoprenyl transferase [Bdellovibrionales bacterium]|nr:isoprenyl transferase [Bdellovibrionales bacterium]